MILLQISMSMMIMRIMITMIMFSMSISIVRSFVHRSFSIFVHFLSNLFENNIDNRFWFVFNQKKNRPIKKICDENKIIKPDSVHLAQPNNQMDQLFQWIYEWKREEIVKHSRVIDAPIKADWIGNDCL